MEKLKEGLCWYFVQEEIKNEYFLSIEYEVIHQNQLDFFLPIQLRRQGNRKELLYDVTGCLSLEEASENNIDFSFCERLLRAIHHVLVAVEEYMLQIEHVNFSKNKIYISKGQKIKFLYSPDESFIVEKEIEELFAWMLSRLDYEDKKGVEFVYYTYNYIRKSGVSKKKIEEILQKAETLKQVKRAKILPKTTSELKEKEVIEVKKQRERPATLPEKVKVVNKTKEKKIIFIGYGFSALWILYFAFVGWKYGYSNTVCRYLIAGIILFGICFFIQYRNQKRERQTRKRKKQEERRSVVEEKVPLDFLEEETRVLSEKDMPDYWRQ